MNASIMINIRLGIYFYNQLNKLKNIYSGSLKKHVSIINLFYNGHME